MPNLSQEEYDLLKRAVLEGTARRLGIRAVLEDLRTVYVQEWNRLTARYTEPKLTNAAAFDQAYLDSMDYYAAQIGYLNMILEEGLPAAPPVKLSLDAQRLAC